MILSLWKNIHVDTIRSFFLNYNWPLLVDSVYKLQNIKPKLKPCCENMTFQRRLWDIHDIHERSNPVDSKCLCYYNQLQTILKYSLINSIIKTLGDSQQGVFSTFIIAYKWYCKNDVFKTSFISKES